MPNTNDAFIISSQPVIPIDPAIEPPKTWWASHWVPLSCGAGIIACSIGSLFFPPLLPICGTVGAVLTGAGFMTTAQSSVVNTLSAQLIHATRKSVEISKQVNFVTTENAAIISQVNKNTSDIGRTVIPTVTTDIGKKLTIMFCALTFSAVLISCSGDQVAKADAILIRIKSDATVALVTGCKDLPVVEVSVIWLESVIPKDHIVDGAIVALKAVDPLAQRLCATIKGLPEQAK